MEFCKCVVQGQFSFFGSILLSYVPPHTPKEIPKSFYFMETSLSMETITKWQCQGTKIRDSKKVSHLKNKPQHLQEGPQDPKMTLVAGHPLHSPHPKTLSTFYSLTNSCRRRSHPDSGNWGSGTQKGSVWSLARDSESATTSAARTRGKSPRALEKKLLGGGGRASMALIEH